MQMITDEIKQDLLNIATTSPHVWASQRASYMISVIAQLESKIIDQTTASNWMWDVIRRLNEDAGEDAPTTRTAIEGMAVQIGDLTV